MLDSTNVTPLDGRLARSRRTRASIVQGLIALLEEGNVQPTIEEIAGRASVAPRTVFQHYADREALFTAVSEQRAARLGELMGAVDAGAGLDERLAGVVAQRARVFEWIAPVRRAALVMEPFSESVHAALDSSRLTKREEIERIFATEIARVPERERATLVAALGAAASWSTWEALRDQQGLDVEQASAALHRTLHGLLRAA
jgi:TetR/AcrR family transcriptional regulator of autoinduction and epiphytic fitness